MVTTQISVTPVGSANYAGSVAKVSTGFLQAVVVWNGSSTWTLKLQSVQSTTTTLATASLTAPAGQQLWWVRLQCIDDSLVASVYNVDPSAVPGATPVATCSAVISGALAQQFGYEQSGFAGLTIGDTSHWCLLDWRVDSLWPCDFTMNVRAVQAPQVNHQPMKNYSRFQRDFQFAVRASDPRILCPTPLVVGVPSLSYVSVALGFTFPMTFPLEFDVPLSEPSGMPLTQTVTSDSEIVIKNRGTWIGRPIVTFYGGTTNPSLNNLSTGVSLKLNGTIADGDFVVADCKNYKLTNSAGAPVMGLFDITGDWMELAPDDNIFQLTGASPVGTPRATISSQHSWK
jgi:hypothetical protein